MKVIDLLNKIANGETPKYIIQEHHKYQYDELENDYYEGNGYDYEYFFKNSNLSCLNDEVEIIEEKKIPEKLNIINGAVDGKWEDGKSYNYTLSAPQTVIIHKLNEVIDYLKSKGE